MEHANGPTEQPSDAAANQTNAERAGIPPLPPRLNYLDGIRALTALYIIQYHTINPIPFLPAWLDMERIKGPLVVNVFIVLSGYCLMLPVVRSTQGELRGGVIEYLRRRARRILPPYYAALLFSIAIILLGRFLGHKPLLATPWNQDGVLPPLNLLLHATLLHNLSLAWYQTLDAPMWSVAPEWQIYFLFPFALLPLWRRFGIRAVVGLTMTCTALPYIVWPALRAYSYLNTWFIAMFALGMAGAVVSFSRRPTETRGRTRLPYGTLAFCFGMACLVDPHLLPISICDILIGLFTMTLLIFCTQQAQCPSPGPRAMALRVLEWPPLVRIGTFSYRLYLIHFPAWWLAQQPRNLLHLQGVKATLFEALVGLPSELLAGYLFYLVVERRFMPGHPRTQEKAARSAALSPAP